MAWYPLRAIGVFLTRKKKDFVNLKSSVESYDFWIENWRNYKTNIQLPDFRHDYVRYDNSNKEDNTNTMSHCQTQVPEEKHDNNNVFNRMYRTF